MNRLRRRHDKRRRLECLKFLRKNLVKTHNTKRKPSPLSLWCSAPNEDYVKPFFYSKAVQMFHFSDSIDASFIANNLNGQIEGKKVINKYLERIFTIESTPDIFTQKTAG